MQLETLCHPVYTIQLFTDQTNSHGFQFDVGHLKLDLLLAHARAAIELAIFALSNCIQIDKALYMTMKSIFIAV